MNAVLGKELLTGALSVISGKALRISDFYYGRNTAESLAYSAWHPHQILAHDPGQLFAEYPMFRDLVLQGLAEADPGVAGTPCAKVVDLIFLRYLEPFLRHDVLDLMLDMSMGGEAPSALVTKVWDTFVRAPRPSPPVEPLLDAHSAFSPSRVGSGRPRDYEWGGAAWDGEERKYKVFYEFLFPEMQPDVLVGKDKLVSLLQSLNAY
jgi:hypothetical protein